MINLNQRELWDEIIVDNFAGGGGASTGIELAIGRSVDIAINHDPDAIAMHKANHPLTEHWCESIWDVDPRTATGGRPVGLAWFSPDCKHFSKAKGGKPVEKKIRGLAWVAVWWAATVKPRVIMLENVEEFKTWGPLKNNHPDPKQKGRTFQCFVKALEHLGYVVEWRELRACDYGAPTTRKRFFLIARCDGKPIVWPRPTHGDPAKPETKAKRLKAWHTAAEIIDWSIPCPSIFDRKKPLCENTMRRIAKGLKKFVFDNPEPFIIQVNHSGENFRGADFDKPFPTVTAKHGFGLITPTIMVNEFNNAGSDIDKPLHTILTGNHHYLASPYISQIGQQKFGGDGRSKNIEEPLSTVVSKNEHLLVAPSLIQYHSEQSGKEVRGQSMAKPIMVVDSSNRYGLVTAFLAKHFGGNYKGPGANIENPVPTITTVDHNALVIPYMTHFYGNSVGKEADEPLGTVTAIGQHIGAVEAFLVKYYGQCDGQNLKEPIHTITTKDRFGLVTIYGKDYIIVDIGMRMLEPRELFNAQGFPDDYIIDFDCNGKKYSRSAQVARAGNAVPPPLPAALVRANLPELCGNTKTMTG